MISVASGLHLNQIFKLNINPPPKIPRTPFTGTRKRVCIMSRRKQVTRFRLRSLHVKDSEPVPASHGGQSRSVKQALKVKKGEKSKKRMKGEKGKKKKKGKTGKKGKGKGKAGPGTKGKGKAGPGTKGKGEGKGKCAKEKKASKVDAKGDVTKGEKKKEV